MLSPEEAQQLTDAEQAQLQGLDPTLVFSAKEAACKLLNPLFRLFIDFHHVEITIDGGNQTFAARYLGDHTGHAIIADAQGYYSLFEGHWLTCMVLARAAR